jgi:hypothetical protein
MTTFETFPQVIGKYACTLASYPLPINMYVLTEDILLHTYMNNLPSKAVQYCRVTWSSRSGRNGVRGLDDAVHKTVDRAAT